MILTLGLIIEGEIFLSLSLSVGPSSIERTQPSRTQSCLFLFLLLLLLSLSLDDDDDDVFTTLFIRAFLSRADIFLLSLSLSLSLSSSCVHRPLLK